MGWVVKATSWPFYPRERPSTQFYRRLGGPPGPVWIWCGKSRPPPEFDPRTVHPVAGVGGDNTINYINTIKAHFLFCNTLYAQNVFVSLHFFLSLSLSFFLSILPFLRNSLPYCMYSQLVLNSTQLQTSACQLLCCRVTNRPFSASDWLRVHSFVLDLKGGLSWLS